MKWLEVIDMGPTTSGKTQRYELRARDGNIIVGRIQWRASWRRYVFEPAFPTVFEPDCLRDIATFLDDLMARK